MNARPRRLSVLRLREGLVNGMHITKHATQRIRERAGVKRRGKEKLARTALDRGLIQCDLKGILRDWVGGKYLSHRKGNNIRVWAEKLFVFQDETLITVIQLPHDMKKIANKLQRRKNEEGYYNARGFHWRMAVARQRRWEDTVDPVVRGEGAEMCP